MRIRLDKKPTERARLEIEETLQQYRACKTVDERLEFLNTGGKTLPQIDPTAYIKLAEEILPEQNGTTHLGIVGRIKYRCANAYDRLLDLDAARKMYRDSLEIADKLGDSVLRNAVVEGLAETQVYSGLAIQGLETLKNGRATYGAFRDDQHEWERRMSSHMIAATALLMTGQFGEGMREMFAFVDVARKRGTNRKPYNIQLHLALMYTFLEEYDKAEALFEIELGLNRASKYLPSLSRILSQFAWMRCRSGRVDAETETMIAEAISIADELDDPRSQISAYITESIYLSAQNRDDEALEIAEKALAMSKQYDIIYTLCQVSVVLGQIHLNLGNNVEARRITLEGLNLAREQQFRLYEIDALEILKNCAAAEEAYEDALAFSEEYNSLRNNYLAQRSDPEFRELELAINAEISRQQLMLELARTENLQDESAKLKAERDNIRQKLISKTIHNSAQTELLNESRSLLKKSARTADGKLKNELKELARKIDLHLDEDSLWREFDEQFALVHPGFQEALRKKHPSLSNTERKVCSLLRLEIPSKDVCRIMGIGVRGIESHRYNIRKKMGVKGKVNFSELLADIR